MPLTRPFDQQLTFFSQNVLQIQQIYGRVSFTLRDLIADTHSGYGINIDMILQGDIMAVVEHFEKQGWITTTARIPGAINIRNVLTLPDFEITPTDAFPAQADAVSLTLPAQHSRASPGLQQQAADAAQLYLELFRVENAARRLIETRLRAAHGDRWLDEAVPPDVAAHVRRMAAHEDRDWLSGPENPSLDFASIDELAAILAADKTKAIYRSEHVRDAVVALLRRLEPYRDYVGHMRVLPDADRKRFLDMVRDLQNRFDNEAERRGPI